MPLERALSPGRLAPTQVAQLERDKCRSQTGSPPPPQDGPGTLSAGHLCVQVTPGLAPTTSPLQQAAVRARAADLYQRTSQDAPGPSSAPGLECNSTPPTSRPLISSWLPLVTLPGTCDTVSMCAPGIPIMELLILLPPGDPQPISVGLILTKIKCHLLQEALLDAPF